MSSDAVLCEILLLVAAVVSKVISSFRCIISQLHFRQTSNETSSTGAKHSDVCLTGRQDRHSALMGAQKIV